MKVQSAEFERAYQSITKGQHGSVVIFVSVQCDSLAACRIFTRLLREDHVPYVIHPVDGYTKLKEDFNMTVNEDAQVRSFVFINCGGTVDLRDFLIEEDFEHPEGVTLDFFILDNHRPFDLANVRNANQNVFLLCDDASFDFQYPDSEEDTDSESESDDEEEEVESEEEEEEDADSDGSNPYDDIDPNMIHNRHLTDRPEMKDINEGGEGQSRKRTKKSQSERKTKKQRTDITEEKMVRRQKKRELRRQTRDYYRCTYYASSTADMIGQLAAQLNRATKESVWLSIIGVTDLYIHEHTMRNEYTMAVQRLRDDVNKHFADLDTDDDRHFLPDGFIKRTPVGVVTWGYEYDVMLLRHWTLYDAMYHSKYVGSHLGIWTDIGKRKFLDFLAKMSLPLSECKRDYKNMDVDCQKRFQKNVREYAKQYGLDRLAYASFHKKHSEKCTLSASDMVYGISALLGGNASDTGSDEDDEIWEKKFWAAYDSISSDNTEKLLEGFEHAKRVQTAIVKQGTLLLEQKMVMCSGPFRFAVIEECSDIQIFIHEIALSSLVRFMLDAYRISMDRKPKPFVICVLNAKQNKYLVAGISAPGGTVLRNQFGTAFREAAERTKARFKHDGFDSCYMEIQKDDKDKFLEMLHSGLIEI